MQLKTPIYAALLCIAMPGAIYGQAGIHQLSLSYGTISGTQLINGLTTQMHDNLSYKPYTDLQTSNTGNIFLTYRYGITRGFDIGFTVGMQRYSFDRVPNDGTYMPQVGNAPQGNEGSYDVTVITYAAEFKPAYYTGKYFQLYGFVGVGMRSYTRSGYAYTATYTTGDLLPQYFINTQWTPIGIRVGKTLSGFAEFGFGYKGLGNIGVSYNLNGHAVSTKKMTQSTENSGM